MIIKQQLIPGNLRHKLYEANPALFSLIEKSADLEHSRETIKLYLIKQEKRLSSKIDNLENLKATTIRDCIRVFKRIISKTSEKKTKSSSLAYLYKYIKLHNKADLTIDFIQEFTNLFKGVVGNFNIYTNWLPSEHSYIFSELKGRLAAQMRSKQLDEMSHLIDRNVDRFITGLDENTIKERQINKKHVLSFFKADPHYWQDYKWQLDHVVRDADTLKNLTNLTKQEKNAVRLANKLELPFGITPYYVSLFDRYSFQHRDHALRAQVLPPSSYINCIAARRNSKDYNLDFMGENDTSPVELVTRRYPQIAIFKPYNTCAQVCVYCQRNWEIDDVRFPGALASEEKTQQALNWFKEHTTVHEVLITGGDPLILPDDKLEKIFEFFARLPHITRIRIGTRTPVVLPMRFTEKLVHILGKYHELGRREIVLVTHFEHVWEITPDVIEAVKKIKKQGINIYNQSVFTFENSRRFEMVALRKCLKLIGIDPYYTFNTKGKEETAHYRVPLARILQERKEEARLVSGMERTDESVFNVPKLGKNHLRAYQDHRLVNILPNGCRIYEFHPWEKNIAPAMDYLYTDVSIWAYLMRLKKRGENIRHYQSIWYYF